MAVNEKDVESLSDVATAFTIAFVGLCRALRAAAQGFARRNR